MKTVEPATICYTAIQVTQCIAACGSVHSDCVKQVYVALSCMEEWGIRDQEVDLSLLYDLFREQFQDLDDSWVKETLDWWNACVLAFRSQTPQPIHMIPQTSLSQSY
jgi:hypothetical protein